MFTQVIYNGRGRGRDLEIFKFIDTGDILCIMRSYTFTNNDYSKITQVRKVL